MTPRDPSPIPASALRDLSFSNPTCYFFLLLPYGISSGLLSITLPFAMVRAGFSVETTASVTALGLSANIWRFAGAPVVDLTLSLRRWYWFGLIVCALTMLWVGLTPLRQSAEFLLAVAVFISALGANLCVIPVGGFIAHTVREEEKGRASGWYQAGNLGGNGLGGGLGVWLVSQYSFLVAAVVLTLLTLFSGFALRFVPDVFPLTTEAIGHRVRAMGRDLWAFWRTPIGLLTTILVASPIGSGALNNLWSSVAQDWSASSNQVALVTGVLNGILSAGGCILGGWWIDRSGRMPAYFGSGILIGLGTIAMVFLARTPAIFTAGVMFYAVAVGIAYAAFSALCILAIGKGAASTKYSVLSSFGNLPVTYMTAWEGWAHDHHGTNGMLLTDALSSIAAVLLAMIAVAWMKKRGMLSLGRRVG